LQRSLVILAVVSAVATRRDHYKAFKKPNAMAMRDGRQISIRAEELVPGDIVLLQSGDKVPADLRLFRVKGLQIQEAALTAAFILRQTLTVDKSLVLPGKVRYSFNPFN
jgi:P-type E1-E2 ATPase